MPIIKCPECGHQVSSLAATCPSCGVAIAGNITKCSHCGGYVIVSQEVCPNCLQPVERPGSPVETNIQSRPSASPKPRVEAHGSRLQSQQNDPVQPDSPEQQPKKHTGAKIAISAFIIALMLVFVGVYFYKTTLEKNELAAYENAMSSSEPAVLQNYLDMYPSAPQERRDSIQAHLVMLQQIDNEWYNAVASQSVYELERYVSMHPESIHVKEANLKIDSLDWITAANTNTMESYQKYMNKHADGEHIDDAKMNYDKLSSAKVSPADVELVSALVKSYLTSGVHADDAALKDLDLSNSQLSFSDDWKVEKENDELTGETSYGVECTLMSVSHEAAGTFRFKAKVSAGRLTDVHITKL